MKLSLTAEIESALKKVRTDLLKQNPLIEKSLSKLAEVLISERVGSLQGRDLEGLTFKLMSPVARKKALLKEVSRLADKADAEGLETIESGFKKLRLRIHVDQEAQAVFEETKGSTDAQKMGV